MTAEEQEILHDIATINNGSGDDDNDDSDKDDEDNNRFLSLPVGVPDTFRIVKYWETPRDVFAWDIFDTPPEASVVVAAEAGDDDDDDDVSSSLFDPDTVQRLALTRYNVTLPVALVLLDPDEFPSFSRARKACRKGNILIHRGPLVPVMDKGDDETTSASKSTVGGGGAAKQATTFDPARCVIGRVGDRIYPGDVVGKQVRMGTGYFRVLSYQKPPFDLPIVFEDDHCALVNKPAGVVVYSPKNGGHGSMTIRAALPFVLQPPQRGTYAVMRRPASVHRLDKPTSGLLCIAKTKPALLDLSRQFHDRIIKKTYFAIVNGIPPESPEVAITSRDAFALGVDIDPNDDEKEGAGGWHLIDSPLDGKHAVTVWRAVKYVKSLRAHDGYLTLVELKPKTGRYHQLRRHMAWQCKCPLVGDSEYDEGTASAMSFRDRGLLLCSTRVVLEHPYYNSDDTSIINQWNSNLTEQFDECTMWKSEESGRIMMAAEVPLPSKFENLLKHEEERYHKFGGDASQASSNPNDDDESEL